MHPRRPIIRLAFAGVLIPASALAGQNQAPSSSAAAPPPAAPAFAQPSAQNPASAAVPAFLHTNANLVLVDVVVTERDNPVHGLDRSRFHVFEDGREQVITSFDEHQPAAAPAPAAKPAALQASLPPHTYTNVPDYPEATAVNVLLLDALNTPMVNQMDVRRQMIQFLGKI